MHQSCTLYDEDSFLEIHQWQSGCRGKFQSASTPCGQLLQSSCNILMNASNDSPFYSIPLEIASSIFHLALSKPPPLSLPALPFSGEEVGGSHTSPFLLGAVCRSWRQTIWTSPVLWSTITCKLCQPPSTEYIEIMQGWLKRSGCYPLTISIYDRNPSLGQILVKDPVVNSLIELFNQYSERWQTLDVFLPSELLSLFCKDRPKPPMLRTLTILASNGSFNCHLDLKKATPRALKLSAHPRFDSIEIIWSKLSQVELWYTPTKQLLQLLAWAPRLELLKIVKVEGDCSPSHAILHDHLRSIFLKPLVYYCRSGPLLSPKLAFEFFLDAVIFPRLETFHYEGYGSLPSSMLTSLFKRSQCSLLSFSARYGHTGRHGDLMDLLEAIPTVRRLDLMSSGESRNTSKLLRRLVRTINPTQKNLFLPDLEFLNVFAGVSISWDALAQIFEPVPSLSSPNHRPLQTIQLGLDSCNILSPISWCIDKTLLPRFLAIKDAGFNIQFYCKVAVDKFERLDLLAQSVAHYACLDQAEGYMSATLGSLTL